MRYGEVLWCALAGLLLAGPVKAQTAQKNGSARPGNLFRGAGSLVYPSQCFPVYSSMECPFLSGLNVVPVNGAFKDSGELETFLKEQDSNSTAYMKEFSAENNCDLEATFKHRYHKSLLCSSLINESRLCRNNPTPKPLCREQCEQYFDSVAESIRDQKMCSRDVSQKYVQNRAMFTSLSSPLRSMCGNLPSGPDLMKSGVQNAGSPKCIRATDAEFQMCGFSDDLDVVTYCKSKEGNFDTCCRVAMNEVLKRVIPLLVNPATDNYWLETAGGIAIACTLGLLAFLISLSRNFKKKVTLVAKPAFRRGSMRSVARPTPVEKELALQSLGEERRKEPAGAIAYYSGARKSMIIDSMRGGPVPGEDLEYDPPEERFVYDDEYQDQKVSATAGDYLHSGLYDIPEDD